MSARSCTRCWSLLCGPGLLQMSRNPISLVQNKGATRKVRKARCVTVEQFHTLLKELREPFATMALLSVCLGLRISEALGLRWSDVDWLGSSLSIRRGIVEQKVADVKTPGSAKTFVLAPELLDRLKSWKQVSQFPAPDDWTFASPLKHGRLPYIAIPVSGVSWTGRQARQASGILARMPADRPIAHGSMPWALR